MKSVLKLFCLCLSGWLPVFTAHAATHNVSMSSFKFVPQNLTVNVGDTVTWVNQDIARHDTVSGIGGVPSGVWQSPLFAQGSSFSHTFNSAGTFPYYCTPHWSTFNMVGSITVVAPNNPPSVSITAPANGSSFDAPANVTISANASDSDGNIARVEFFVNGNSIGVDSSFPYSATANGLGPGTYTLSATATDNAGSTATASISINVSGIQPGIINPPQSQIVTVGSDVLFSVSASGGSPLEYQWSFNSEPISGATATTLLLSNVQLAASGDYSVLVSNPFGTASASATLVVTNVTVQEPPEFTLQPEPQTVVAGTNVTFSVAAVGSLPLSYQWFFGGEPLPGDTNSFLQLTNVSQSNEGLYFAVASNPFGARTSSVVQLTILLPPPCSFALSKTNVSFTATGGNGNVNLTTGESCIWNVINTNAWITLLSTNNGQGSQLIAFIVAANTSGRPRQGTMRIGDATLAVQQAGRTNFAKSDFNGDGFSDFLWQHQDGRLTVWLMQGTQRSSSHLLRPGTLVNVNWRLSAVADFNGNRGADILWHHTDGRVGVWIMKGLEYARSELVANAPKLDSNWRILGAADFNSDGHSDILWRHNQGYLVIWLLNRTRFVSQTLVLDGEPIPPQWTVAGLADFNGDRQVDLLWQNQTSLLVWYMQGGNPQTSILLSGLKKPDGYQVVGVADVNDDGNSDLIWRKSSGELNAWFMNGINRTGSTRFIDGKPIPIAWKFVSPF